MRKIFIMLIVIVALSALAFAGGSFSLDIELRPILNQFPKISEYLEQTLEIEKSGWANRIGQNVNPLFGGKRVGPYHVRAKPKGKDGDYCFDLTINTKLIYKNKSGNETDLPNAYSIDEKFVSVVITPIKYGDTSSLKPFNITKKDK